LNQDVTDGHILGIQGLSLRRVDLSHEIAQIAGRIESGDVDDLVRVGVMSHRDTAVDFTRGAMDRIRELAGIADVPDSLLEFGEGWSLVVFGGIIYEFRWIEPRVGLVGHPPKGLLLLGVSFQTKRGKPKEYDPLCFRRTREEGREAALLFMRGIKPPLFLEEEGS